MRTRVSIIHSKRPLRREVGTCPKTAFLWLRTSVLVLVLTYSPEYSLPQLARSEADCSQTDYYGAIHDRWLILVHTDGALSSSHPPTPATGQIESLFL